MATLTIRNLPDDVRDRLRVRAASHGRSMEAEVRDLLAAAVQPAVPDVSRLADDIRAAQESVARYIPAGSYTVDDFLAEKALELDGEDRRWERLAREADERSGREAR